MNGNYDPNNPFGGYVPIDPRQMRPRNNHFATASLILGIFSMICMGLLPSILAIVFAVLDRKQNGSFSTASLVGLILGIVATVIAIPLLIYNMYTMINEVEQLLLIGTLF
ncbi:MAG: hypothetical protein IJW71_01200 [Clostridia bacterium]|nr:hypothetical protein [Clostridia bacterium]